MMLDPQARFLLEKAAAAQIPGPEQVSAHEARDIYKRGRLPLQPPKPVMAVVRDLSIEGVHGPITVRE